MRKGFTLMELMVALATAGILVSVALGMYGSFYRGYVASRDAYAAATFYAACRASFSALRASLRTLCISKRLLM